MQYFIFLASFLLFVYLVTNLPLHFVLLVFLRHRVNKESLDVRRVLERKVPPPPPPPPPPPSLKARDGKTVLFSLGSLDPMWLQHFEAFVCE